jgi:catechol 2,3-dioxygenase-like lactoylglutathione lyase family enzyme
MSNPFVHIELNTNDIDKAKSFYGSLFDWKLNNVQMPVQIVEAMMVAERQISERFRTGKGFGWHEHDPLLLEGTERFFRRDYNANLVGSWIPALDESAGLGHFRRATETLFNIVYEIKP